MTVKSNALVSLFAVTAIAALGVSFQQRSQVEEIQARLDQLEGKLLDGKEARKVSEDGLAELAQANLRLRAEMSDAEQQIAALRSRQEKQADTARVESAEEPTKSKTPGKKAALEERFLADTFEQEKLLDSLQVYVDDVDFLPFEELSKKEASFLGPYKDQLTLIRGSGDRIGMFGLMGDGKQLADVPEELDPWIDAYAAVSFQYRTERSRVIEGLLLGTDLPRFPSKREARDYETRQRDAHYEQHGTRHGGWSYEHVDGEFVLIERETVDSDQSLTRLQDLREQIQIRIGESGGGVMEKWIPTQ